MFVLPLRYSLTKGSNNQREKDKEKKRKKVRERERERIAFNEFIGSIL